MPTRSPRQVASFPIVLRELTVLRVTDVTPSLRRVTLVEETLPADSPDPLIRLQLHCAFGSTRRPVPDATALAEKAGPHLVESRELGWDHHLRVLERPA